MPIVSILPRGRASDCYLNAEGRLFLPSSLLDSLKWQHGTKISLGYISEPLILLLRRGDTASGFTLMRRNNAKSDNSPRGVITCTAFANKILRARIALPHHHITSVLLRHGEYQLAVILESPVWVQEEFSQSGRQKVPSDVKGVYQLLGANEHILRIGEGVISNRIAQHLKNDEYLGIIRFFRYLALDDKEEMNVLEQILLASYEATTGQLPRLNLIHK